MVFHCSSSLWLQFLVPTTSSGSSTDSGSSTTINSTMGMAKIKEGKGVLGPTVIPCRKKAPLSFFRMGTHFTLEFEAQHTQPRQGTQAFLLSLAAAVLISSWSQSMSHWSYNETLCLSALLNRSHHNYPLGFDLVNVCPNKAPQRESNEPLLKEGRTAGIILVCNYMHKHTASNRLKAVLVIPWIILLSFP